jgi:hypothetical protein
VRNLLYPLIFSLLFIELARAEKNSAPQENSSEIQVTLFGQTCQLAGPFGKKALQEIHSISPEKIPPSLSLEQAKAALTLLETASNTPKQLSPYKEALFRRINAQASFQDVLTSVRKGAKLDLLFSAVEPHVPAEKLESLKARIQKLNQAGGGAPAKWNAATLEKVNEALEDSLEAYPEELFHRTIQKLKIQYQCGYSETGE